MRDLRETRGLSREVLAVNAGLTTTTLARLELGRSDPSWSTICALATALNITLTDLARAIEAQERS